MSRIRLSVLAVAVVALSILLLAGCPVPIVSSTSGALTITIGDQVSRTLVPLISMQPATYAISGSGPNGATFSQTTTGGSVTIPSLAFGTWTVTVDALNAQGTLIGQGSGSADVHSGSTTTLAISVTPLAGNGTLLVLVSWPASQVESPSIRASLIPSSGSPVDLAFNMSTDRGSFESDAIPAGYQTLTLQVLDNGVPVAGAVEVVRIVAGESTIGHYDFTNVNSPGGSLIVNVTPAMADPIPLSIDVDSTILLGHDVTATASVGDQTTNVVYVWYLNGVSLPDMGSSLTFGSTLAKGYYRLDVTGYTADGKRAGSATANIQVTDAVPAPSLQQIEYYDFQAATYRPIGNIDIFSQQGLPTNWPAVQAANPGWYDFSTGLTPFGGYRVDLSYENYRFTASDPSASMEFWVGDVLLATGTGTVSGTQRWGTAGIMSQFPPPYLPVGTPLLNVRVIITKGGQTVTYTFPNMT